MAFVRKNLLVISGRFDLNNDPDDVDTQPSSANAVLVYQNSAGTKTTTTIGLTKDANDVWSGTWDSSATRGGEVNWMIYSLGAVVAAAQGSFYVEANEANTV